MRVAKTRIVDLAVCGLWAAGCASLLVDSDRIAADIAQASGVSWTVIRVGLVAVVGLEAFLAAGMLAAPGAWARWTSVALLGVFTLYLGVRGAREGWAVSCDCIEVIAQSRLAGVLRNVAFIVVVVWVEVSAGRVRT